MENLYINFKEKSVLIARNIFYLLGRREAKRRETTVNRFPYIQICNGYVQLSNEMSVTLGNQRTSFQKV